MLNSCRNVQQPFVLVLDLTAFNAQLFLYLLCSNIGIPLPPICCRTPVGSILAQLIIFSLTRRPCLVLICCLQDVY